MPARAIYDHDDISSEYHVAISFKKIAYKCHWPEAKSTPPAFRAKVMLLLFLSAIGITVCRITRPSPALKISFMVESHDNHLFDFEAYPILRPLFCGHIPL